ncbi:MAG: hypothetical protein IKE24_09525 [Clostridia bacterium]|nr:hypothetical protein [Clostridia bacterium]
MYRRYSQVNQAAVSVSQVRRNRIRNILILILAAGLAAMTAVALPAVRSREAGRQLYIQRMQNEIATAVRLTTSLSRNAGANSAAILAQIRSNVYTIGVINEISIGQEGAGGRLIQEDRIASLQSEIDHYLAFLTTGMDTGEYQTNLQNSLNALQVDISALEQ